jgi:methionyl-tRNA formyltransferase
MSTNRFIFFATGGLLSSICLKKLAESGKNPVLTVILDKSDTVYPNLTLQIAKQNQLEFILIPNLDQKVIDKIIALSPDFGVMASFGSIIKEPLISAFKIYNVHMGVLPHYRGPVTNFWKILKGDDVFGATIHEISEEIDGGHILKVVEQDFSSVTGASDFFTQNYTMAAEGLIEVLHNRTRIISKFIDTKKGNYYPKISHEDLKLSANEPVQKLHKVINRLQFYGHPHLLDLRVTNATLLQSIPLIGQKPEIISLDTTKSIFKNGSGVLLLNHLPIDYSNDF